MNLEVPVKGHEQIEEWSCGPAALKILLSTRGYDISESELIELTGCNKTEGTRDENLVSTAQKLGFGVTSNEGTSDSDFFRLLGSGHALLCNVQGKSGGHFVIVHGLQNNRLQIEDPRTHGPNKYTLSWPLFRSRWWALEYGTRRLIDRWMMTIE